MRSPYWHIQGYDSTTKIYDRKVAANQLSQDQMRALLKVLAAKAGLSFDEIVGAYARRRSKIANDLLEVRRDGPHCIFMCGENPHFVARIIPTNNFPILLTRHGVNSPTKSEAL